MTAARIVARLVGPLLVRLVEASSPKVASRTWPFSLDDSHRTGARQVRQAPKGHGFVFCGFKRT